jgi:hypothetical protein
MGKCGLDASGLERNQWQAVVKMVMNPWVPQKMGNFLTSQVTVGFSE